MPQQVTWTNEVATYSGQINRSNPYTIAWTGGDANGWVDIQGFTDVGGYDLGFECAAPATAGQFTIPASILLGMPTGAAVQAGISVSTYAIPSSLGAVPGFDLADDASTFQTSVPVIFQ